MPEQREAQPEPQPSEPQNWYTSTSDRPFVDISVASAGPSRETDEQRTELAGSMAFAHAQMGQPDLGPEERVAAAQERIAAFLESRRLDPAHTIIMAPQLDFSEPLGIIDVDQEFAPGQNGDVATTAPRRGDFLFTRNPDVVLGCKPADCPVMIGECADAQGQKLLFLLHLNWMELDAGYIDQAFEYLTKLGVETSSLRLYLTRGARVQSYGYYNPDNPFEGGDRHVSGPHREELFVNLHQEPIKDGQMWWFWNVDTFGFIHNRLRERGVQDWQVYEDPTDTATTASGNSSNNRQFNTGEPRSTDLVVATMRRGAENVSYPPGSYKPREH